jgi:glycosyltransferase involved in cell wall biosynthesis
MRILQYIDSFMAGGAEKMCVNITNVLHENGYEVQVCISRKGGPLQKAITSGIKCHILGKKNFFDIPSFIRFIRLLKKEEIDVIHAHSSSVFWAIFAKLFVTNIKVIWHDHQGMQTNDRRCKFFYRLISYGLNGIIAVNKSLEAWSRKKMRVTPDAIFFIPNFPLLEVKPIHKDPDYLRIVCLANIRSQKDHITLIRAVSILAGKNLTGRLKVILAGAYNQDKYFHVLLKIIDEFRLNDVIEFTGSVEDTASLLSQADIGVLTSVSEGFPVSLLEYGLAALPVVVTDVGQCSEIVDHGRLGRVVPPQEPELFAGELQWIIENIDAAINMGLMFKEHVEKEYGKSNFLSAYQKLLKSI